MAPTRTLADLKSEITEVFDHQLRDLLLNRHILRQIGEAWKRRAARRD